VKGWGDSASAICVAKILETTTTTTGLPWCYLPSMFYFVLCELLFSRLVCIVVVVLCVLLSSDVIICAVFTLDAGLLARSQYSERPVTGHLDTGSSWFPSVYKQMLRWLPKFQVVTTCFSYSPPNLNLLVNNFIFCIPLK